VSQHVKVKLSIRKYEDNVLCDVVAIEACYILLGRSWQFNKKTMYNGLTNKITFTHKENKFSFHPLLLSQVVEYQVQMRNKRNEEKKGSNLENKNE